MSLLVVIFSFLFFDAIGCNFLQSVAFGLLNVSVNSVYNLYYVYLVITFH